MMTHAIVLVLLCGLTNPQPEIDNFVPNLFHVEPTTQEIEDYSMPPTLVRRKEYNYKMRLGKPVWDEPLPDDAVVNYNAQGKPISVGFK